MFGWEFPPYNSGGLGVACQGLAEALAAKNVEVIFVLPKKIPVKNEPFRFRFANVPNLTIAEINSLLVPYITSEKYALLKGVEPGGQYGATLFEEVKRYAFLARAIAKSEQHDVIHAHDWLSFGAGIGANSISGRPLIAHVHATEVDRTAGHSNQLIYDKEREGVHKADRVVAVSEFTKKVLQDHYGVSGNKVSVVHNGIDSSHYYIGKDDSPVLHELKEAGYKIVLFLGRITIMKGPDYFLKAAKKVLEYEPKAIFVMAGSGDMEGQIMREAAEMGISDKVLFTGFVRGKELSEVYKSADLFVLPSVAEPFGLTPLESLLHGTPVLISKQSGASEVLKNALKTDFWDVDDMADKILSVISYPSLHDTLAVNGSKDAYSCNWGKAASECINVYNSLI